MLRGWGAGGVKCAAWVRRGVPGAARFGVGSRGAAVPGGSAVLRGFVQAVGWARGAGAALGLGAGEAVVEGRGGVARISERCRAGLAGSAAPAAPRRAEIGRAQV